VRAFHAGGQAPARTAAAEEEVGEHEAVVPLLAGRAALDLARRLRRFDAAIRVRQRAQVPHVAQTHAKVLAHALQRLPCGLVIPRQRTMLSSLLLQQQAAFLFLFCRRLGSQGEAKGKHTHTHTHTDTPLAVRFPHLNLWYV